MKYLFKLLILLAVISPIALEASSGQKCELGRREEGWIGRCGVLNGYRLTLPIRQSDSITSGASRPDMKPASAWSGTMNIGEHLQRPFEIERYPAGPVV
jgi:hypothetical protein